MAGCFTIPPQFCCIRKQGHLDIARMPPVAKIATVITAQGFRTQNRQIINKLERNSVKSEQSKRITDKSTLSENSVKLQIKEKCNKKEEDSKKG